MPGKYANKQGRTNFGFLSPIACHITVRWGLFGSVVVR